MLDFIQNFFSKKTNIVIAVALVVFLSASVVRCVSTPKGDKPPETIKAEETTSATIQPEISDESTNAARSDFLNLVREHRWISEDGNSTLSFSTDRYSETNAMVQKITLFTITALEVDDDGYSLHLSVSDESKAGSRPVTLTVSKNAAGFLVTSDGFLLNESYRENNAAPAGLEVIGLDREATNTASPLELIGGHKTELVEQISDFCASSLPQVTAVTFTGEVYIDYSLGQTSLMFKANDERETSFEVVYTPITATFAVHS